MQTAARGPARLGDKELRINRAIADRIRLADAERVDAPEAPAVVSPPSEPLDVPDMVAAPEDVASLRARLRRISDELQDPSRWRHGPLGPIDPVVHGDEGQGDMSMGLVGGSKGTAPSGYGPSGIMGGPHPRDASVWTDPLQINRAAPGRLPAAGLSTHAWARRQAAEKVQGPRGPNGLSADNESAADNFVTSGNDLQLGFVGAQDDADYMYLISSMGASPGPFRRERRAASRRVVSEMYSPPRVTRAISTMPGCDLIRGFTLDLTCLAPDGGMPWDFDVPAKRDNAMRKVRTEKPAMIIGSVMCTA